MCVGGKLGALWELQTQSRGGLVGLLAQQEDPTWAKLLGLVVDSREVTFSRGQDSQDSGRVWGPVEVQVDGGEEGGHVGGPHPVRQVWNQAHGGGDDGVAQPRHGGCGRLVKVRTTIVEVPHQEHVPVLHGNRMPTWGTI